MQLYRCASGDSCLRTQSGRSERAPGICILRTSVECASSCLPHNSFGVKATAREQLGTQCHLQYATATTLAEDGEHVIECRGVRFANRSSYDGPESSASRSDATASASTSASSTAQHQRISSLDAPGLTSLIKRCQSPQSLQKLICLHGDSFNVVHIGAACTQLVRTAQQADQHSSAQQLSSSPGTNSYRRPQRKASLDTGDSIQHSSELLLVLIHQHMQQMGARQRANIAWALSKWPVQVQRANDLLSILVHAFEQDLDACQPAEMSMTLYASAYAGIALPRSWLWRLSQSWGLHLGHLKSQELSNVLWALGQQHALHVCQQDAVVEPVFLHALLRAQHQRGLACCQAQELLQSLQGLALLEARPPAPWLAACWSAAQQHMAQQHFTAVELTQMLGWASRLQLPIPAPLLQAASTALAHAVSPPLSVDRSAASMSQSAPSAGLAKGPSKAQSLAPSDAVFALWGLAEQQRMQHGAQLDACEGSLQGGGGHERGGDAQLDADSSHAQGEGLRSIGHTMQVLHDCVLQHGKVLDTCSVCRLLYASSVSSTCTGTLTQPGIAPLMVLLSQHAAAMTASQLSMSIWAYARLQQHHPPQHQHQLLQLLLSRCLPLAQLFEPRQLASILHSIGLMKHPVPAVWLNAMLDQVTADVGRYSSLELSQVFAALVSLGSAGCVDAQHTLAQRLRPLLVHLQLRFNSQGEATAPGSVVMALHALSRLPPSLLGAAGPKHVIAWSAELLHHEALQGALPVLGLTSLSSVLAAYARLRRSALLLESGAGLLPVQWHGQGVRGQSSVANPQSNLGYAHPAASNQPLGTFHDPPSRMEVPVAETVLGPSRVSLVGTQHRPVAASPGQQGRTERRLSAQQPSMSSSPAPARSLGHSQGSSGHSTSPATGITDGVLSSMDSIDSLHEAADRAGLSPRWLSAWLRASRQHLPLVTPRHAASMLWSCHSLGMPLPRSWLGELLTAVQPQLVHASDQELGMMLHGLGKLRCQPPSGWLRDALMQVLQRAESLDERVVTATLTGLADMGWRHEGRWLHAFAHATMPQLLHMHRTRRRSCYVALSSLDASLAAHVGQDFELLAQGQGSSAGGTDSSSNGSSGSSISISADPGATSSGGVAVGVGHSFKDPTHSMEAALTHRQPRSTGPGSGRSHVVDTGGAHASTGGSNRSRVGKGRAGGASGSVLGGVGDARSKLRGPRRLLGT